MVIRSGWQDMVSGFLGEDLSEFKEFLGKNDRRFAFSTAVASFVAVVSLATTGDPRTK